MSLKLSLLAFDKQGFKVSLSVEADDVLKAVGEYEAARKYAEQEGWQADGIGAAAAKSFAQPHDSLAKVTGAGECQFCGNTVEGVEMNGKVFTPQQISTGRAEKMAKLGHKAAPVCGPCWKSRNLKNEYDRAFPFVPRGR